MHLLSLLDLGGSMQQAWQLSEQDKLSTCPALHVLCCSSEKIPGRENNDPLSELRMPPLLSRFASGNHSMCVLQCLRSLTFSNTGPLTLP